MAEQTEIFVEAWDKKKIAVGISVLVLLIAAGVAVKQYVLPTLGITNNQQAVQGAEDQAISPTDTPKTFSLPSVQDVSNQVQQLQQKVSGLTVAEVASSSPQIQQVIQQIQALPQMPSNAAKAACEQICSKL